MDWLLHMERAFRLVRRYIQEEGLKQRQVLGPNPKGDITLGFDIGAEKIAVDYFRRHVAVPLRIICEEQGIIDLDHDDNGFICVIDPVDGSWNCSRGIEVGSFSIAVLPPNCTLRPENVSHAFTGNLFTGTTFSAEIGKGAKCNGIPVKSSKQENLSEAVIGCDLTLTHSHKWKIKRVSALIGLVRRVVSLGSAVSELSLVASGALDAHVDARDELSPENFLAAGRIILEAGGVISAPTGDPLPPLQKLDEKTSIIASGNQKLHESILRHLQLEQKNNSQ